MRRVMLYLADEDDAYIRHLAGYLAQVPDLPFEVCAFTRAEPLREALDAGAIPAPGRAVLIGPGLLAQLGSLPRDCAVCLLAQPGEDLPEGEGGAISRYQRGDTILEQLVSACREAGLPVGGKEEMAPQRPEAQARLIGVYSPVGRCGKTTLALALGLVLAEQEPTLYLNLEDYHGFEMLLHRGSGMDLSDLVYRMRQGEGGFVFSLQGLLRSFGPLDYIPPAFRGGDLRAVSGEEWEQLIWQVAREGEYESVILDLGTQIEEVTCLLRRCQTVLTPTLEDAWAAAKVHQFFRELEATGQTMLKERIRLLHVPQVTEAELTGFPEGLSQGRHGSYARRLLRELSYPAAQMGGEQDRNTDRG